MKTDIIKYHGLGSFLEGVGGGLIGPAMGLALEGHEDNRQVNQQQKLTNMQVNANMGLAKYGQGLQLDTWNKTNAEAQMEHYKNAGLNPGLMYGMGGGGGSTTGSASAGTASAGNAAGQSGEIGTMTGAVGMGLQMKAQTELLQAQKENIEADTAKKRSEVPVNEATVPNIGADTVKKGAETVNINQNTENQKAGEALTKVQTGLQTVMKEIAEDTQWAQSGIITQQFQKLINETNQVANNNEITAESKAAQISKIQTEANNAVIQGEAMKAGIQLNEASVAKMSADIKQKGIELGIRQFEAEFRANHPEYGAVVGQMISSIKAKLEKMSGISQEYIAPIKMVK